jgi:hypothetical protein
MMKKGSESAILKNEKLDFLTTFKRGLQITQNQFLNRKNPDTRTFATAAPADPEYKKYGSIVNRIDESWKNDTYSRGLYQNIV